MTGAFDQNSNSNFQCRPLRLIKETVGEMGSQVVKMQWEPETQQSSSCQSPPTGQSEPHVAFCEYKYQKDWSHTSSDLWPLHVLVLTSSWGGLGLEENRVNGRAAFGVPRVDWSAKWSKTHPAGLIPDQGSRLPISTHSLLNSLPRVIGVINVELLPPNITLSSRAADGSNCKTIIRIRSRYRLRNVLTPQGRSKKCRVQDPKEVEDHWSKTKTNRRTRGSASVRLWSLL